jgi:transcriptional regulator with XRE-family HTH domain
MLETPATFAARLKQLRIRKGESLQKAADAVAISKPHFWELEKGESRNPSKELMERMAKHYQVTVAYLLGEQSEDEAKMGALFRDLRDLKPDQQANIRALIDSMKQKPKE